MAETVGPYTRMKVNNLNGLSLVMLFCGACVSGSQDETVDDSAFEDAGDGGFETVEGGALFLTRMGISGVFAGLESRHCLG